MTYRQDNDESGHQTVSAEDACEYILKLDLDYIVQVMCAPDYSLPRWTLADALHCARLYKNFLILLKENPREELVPTREIDEFWHNHILYTKNYHRDCLNIFGYYLHHEPASPVDDPEKLVSHYQKTKAYYLEKFSHPLELIVSGAQEAP
jgi:hypothetical protein